MGEAGGPLRIGLVGHRSFIARALSRELTERGHYVIAASKPYLGLVNLSWTDCVFLVLGRARPTQAEADDELDQVRRYATVEGLTSARTVYMSSRLDMPHKREAERIIGEMGGVVLRPPAVFGPDQPRDSGMLIPSLVRTSGSLALDRPDAPTDFVSSRSLARYMADLATDPEFSRAQVRTATDDAVSHVPGSFRLTPTQVAELVEAFRGLST